MQDSLDNFLDREIASALRAETTVTNRQKELAWERLRAGAARQMMLAPLPAARPSASERLFYWLRRGLLTCACLLFDDTRYDRAMRHRRTRHPYSMLEAPLRNLVGGVAT